MRTLIKNNKLRHIMRMMIAVLSTFIFYRYVYSHALGLMLFSTIFVMLTSVGSAFFQGLLRFLLLMLAAIMLHGIFPFLNETKAILLGSLIGIVMNTLVFPDRIDLEFKNTVVPFLKAARDYFSEILDHLKDEKKDNKAKIQFEETLLALPAWVYKPGFDSTLQKGYRYYFMKLNQLAEILFAMNYLTQFPYDKEWIVTIESPLMQCKQGVDEFVAAIINLLDLEKPKKDVTDFEDAINAMDAVINKMRPGPLDLLDTQNPIKYLIEFAYQLRELRFVMIQLAKACRV